MTKKPVKSSPKNATPTQATAGSTRPGVLDGREDEVWQLLTEKKMSISAIAKRYGVARSTVRSAIGRRHEALRPESEKQVKPGPDLAWLDVVDAVAEGPVREPQPPGASYGKPVLLAPRAAGRVRWFRSAPIYPPRS